MNKCSITHYKPLHICVTSQITIELSQELHEYFYKYNEATNINI